MKQCVKCNNTHRNRKYDKCNQCLERKKCINEDCKKITNKDMEFCYKCYKSKQIKLTGVCLINDDY